jgi:pilus assembly protein CpaC
MLAATALGVALPFAEPTPAIASDLDSMVDADSEGHFVRMGLNKSIVVKLPAEARDVIVGNEEIVDAFVRTKTMAYLFARKVGQTNIFFFDANGQQILNLDIEVTQDTSAIKQLIRRALPGSKITVDAANRNIILGGIARNALEAKTAIDLANQYATNNTIFGGAGASVINTMKILGEDQVMLKIKVVEIQRDVLKQFGINFSALLSAGKFAFNLASVNPFTQNLLSSTGGYKGVYASGSNRVEGLIRAMEGDGLIRTLAEPNLTALTGQAAAFKAGGEFPYQECTRSTTSEFCEIKFKEYGISVDFTPTVLDEGRINLKINTEVSELSTVVSGNQNIPGVNKRSANTVLEMPSGGTMMLAGLIRESTRHNINGTPGLKRLPVLGTLFRSRDFIANETELVIFATPYLVRPTGEQNFASPDQGFNPPTDKQANFMGHLSKVYGTGAAPSGTYHGNVGFIVE